MLSLKKSSAFYIDLGTTNTLVYQRQRGFILNEPTVVAFKQRDSKNQLVATGSAAKKMLGRNPENIRVEKPLREGVIADFNGTTAMLKDFFLKLRANRSFSKPTVVISLPHQVSHYESEAVKAVGKDLGAGSVYLIDEPTAAAMGAGLSVMGPRATLIIDIGGGTSEIAILSRGEIVLVEAIRVGGDDIDKAIIQHLRTQLNFLIGEQTAEKLKLHVASAVPGNHNGFLCVGGLDLQKGLPDQRWVSADFIYPAVNFVVKQIVQAIQAALQKTSPDVAADIIDSGMVLSGGGALLRNLSQRFEKEFNVKTHLAKNPLNAVAQGGALAVEDYNILERMAK